MEQCQFQEFLLFSWLIQLGGKVQSKMEQVSVTPQLETAQAAQGIRRGGGGGGGGGMCQDTCIRKSMGICKDRNKS